MTRLEAVTRSRLEKLERLRQRGIDPYPPRFNRSHSNAQAVEYFEKELEPAVTRKGLDWHDQSLPEFRLCGRITALRDMGKATFLDIVDGTRKIQVYLHPDSLGGIKYEELKDFDIGDFAGATGHLFRTRRGEITMEASSITILCKSLQPLPEKWHGLTDSEKRYRQRYLDLISNPSVKAVFEKRSAIITAIRAFMNGRGFLEVETPVLQQQAGGAMAHPFITHHEALDQDLYLRIALELYLKRVIVGGFDKVYEIGRVFRNEGISIKHNPEFTLLESYEAFADYNTVMQMVEDLVISVARQVLNTTGIKFGDNSIDLTPPWKRVTLREAIKEHSGIDFEEYPDDASLRNRMIAKGMKFDENKGRGKLIDELLSTFVEPKMIQPTFLIDYPVELSPLAKKKPDNPRLVERFECFAGGLEIANAFTELNDPQDQRRRFEEQVKACEAGDREAELPDEDFLLALEYGMPPTGGLGIGIDRLVMLLTDQSSIRDTILFPHLKSRE